jgi:hypothetical protein
MNYIFIFIGIMVLYFMFRNTGQAAHIKTLVKQAAKWATAAQQDASPVTSMLHANYASGYLWALKDIAKPKDIHRVTGIDFKKFEEHITNVQSMVTKKMIKKCPELEGEVDLYLSSIANT